MSPRAAWRLEAAGFGPVYDYVAGKSDWLAADLPFEGTAQLAAMFTRRPVATGRPEHPGAGGAATAAGRGVRAGDGIRKQSARPMIAGFFTAWPVSTWLIRRGIKETT